MSIYSGFATRQQQQLYFSYVVALLETLQKRLLKFYHKEEADEQKFTIVLKRLCYNMRKMEKYKYLEPKLSEAVNEIYEYLVPDKSVHTRGLDKSDVQSLNMIHNTEPLKVHPVNLSKQKLLIEEFEAEAQKRSQSFRIKRPLTTKFSSTNKSKDQKQKSKQKQKPSEPKQKTEDETIRNVLQQYLSGPGGNNLTKAQKHYMRAYKRHKNEVNMVFKNIEAPTKSERNGTNKRM